MLQRIPGGTLVLVLALLSLFCVALASIAFSLQEEARVMRAQLKEERESSENLRNNSRETSAQLVAATQDLLTASQELEAARRQLGGLERQNHALQSENTYLNDRIGRVEDQVSGLEIRHGALSTSVTSLESQNESLKGTLENTEAELQRVEMDNASLLAERSGLTRELQEIKGTIDSLDSMEKRIGELKTEIDELEGKRKALLVRSRTTDILCTGSMEPALTCLDSVTILTNFRPEDIVVGSIISFYEEGDTDTTPYLHRVLERKVENGVYYYWPKGDASEEPDGYWVPEDWLEGYVTELHKNSHPENAELRNEVLARKQEFNEAEANYDAVEYEVCGDIDPGDICYTSEEGEDRLDQAYDAYLLAWCEYVAVLNSAELAGTGLARILPYECWGRL